MGTGFGLLVLAADIWAIVNIFGSRSSNAAKVVWTVVILVLFGATDAPGLAARPQPAIPNASVCTCDVVLGSVSSASL
jgi:hypothetical protein